MLLKLELAFHRPGSSYPKRGQPQHGMAIYYCPVIPESKARKEKKRGREGWREIDKEKEGSKRSPKIP